MKFVKPTFWTLCLLLFSASLFMSCSDDEDLPPLELEEEEISEVILTFTPTTAGGTPLSFVWTDPDGEGPEDPIVDNIVLTPNTEYLLTIELAGPNDENVTEEIEEEAEAHMFFFGWSPGLFSSPGGTGNISSAAGTVNYEDEDTNGLPLGLSTRWTTGDEANGNLRIILKHQPNSKSSTATINTGETDLDAEWQVSIQ